MVAQRYLHETGATLAQLAAIAVEHRRHASLHPQAHKTAPITLDDVMGSKVISSPLRLLDCCLISDAAGAMIVTSAERARKGAAEAGVLVETEIARPTELPLEDRAFGLLILIFSMPNIVGISNKVGAIGQLAQWQAGDPLR